MKNKHHVAIAWDVKVPQPNPKKRGVIEYWLIDTVFFIETMSEDEVRRSLIDHDGYPSNIVVVRETD